MEDVNFKEYPCEKTNCRFRKKWVVLCAEPKKKKLWESISGIHYKRWIVFGVAGCKDCKHYKGFDLYVEGE